MHSCSMGLQNYSIASKNHFLCRYLQPQIDHLVILQGVAGHQPCEVQAWLEKPDGCQDLGLAEA